MIRPEEKVKKNASSLFDRYRAYILNQSELRANTVDGITKLPVSH